MPFYGNVTMCSPGFVQAAGSAAEGTTVFVWTAPRTKAFAEFLRSFETRAGRKPTLEISTVPSYDVARLLVQYLSSAEEAASGKIEVDKLRDYFYRVKDYNGLSGNITISSDGAARTLEIKRHAFSGGKIVEQPISK